MSNILDIDTLVEPLAVLYDALDTELFLSIITEMNIDIDNGGSEEWLEEKIKNTKRIEKANATIIQKYNRLIIPEVNKIALGINSTGVATKSITSIINSFKRNASRFVNYTNTQCLQTSNTKYLDIVNTAYLDVETGLRTFEQSVTRATKQLADEGIRIQSYETGNTINVRSGVARNIKTQTGKSARDIQESYAKEFKLSIFESSSHAGARPKCFNDQGKLWDDNGNSGEIEDINGKKYKYYSVKDSSIGEKDGLYGINCTHTKYYVEDGLFTKTFDVYKKKENDIIYAYDQKVNYYKNEIEKEKRRLEGFEKTNNKVEQKLSNERLKEKRKKLREFKKENLPKMEKLAQQGIIK